MKKILVISGVIALSLAATVDANAWTRNRTVTGAYGTSNLSASGSCYNGTCSRSATRTGPRGYSSTRNSTMTCANGTCTGSANGTGPYGRTSSSTVTVTHN